MRIHFKNLNSKKDGCVLLQNAWNKYGEDNFKDYILELCDIEKLDDREEYYIENLKSLNTENGYNILKRGFSRRGIYHTEETKEKMRNNHSDRHGENHPMFGLRGEDNPNYGKKRTLETKEKISRANKGRLEGNKNPMFGIRLFGEDNPFFKRKHTNETKEIISNTNKNNKYNIGKKERTQLQNIMEYLLPML